MISFKLNHDIGKLKHAYSLEELKPITINEVNNKTKFEITDTVLVIDFGTSNTTAGAFLRNNYINTPDTNDILNRKIKLNEINYVEFTNLANNLSSVSTMIPSIVYICDCSDTDNIKYAYGHGARSLLEKAGYSMSASSFHGIKRWVNSYTEEVQLYDVYGNTAAIKKGEIIKAFLKHVIDTAEGQFKCRFKNLHISTPTSLKQQYFDMFEEILPEYNIERERSIDEATAVLYNSIADSLEKGSITMGEEHTALVIDCGGGTTDISSCTFKVEQDGSIYNIAVNSSYKNSDNNFGGNNITYRIMQFIKIAFASFYKNPETRIQLHDIIDVSPWEIFEHIEKNGVSSVYYKLNKYYEEAEGIIPTRYKDYENETLEDYQRVKRNFYLLWGIAENMKIKFFNNSTVVRSKVDHLNGKLSIIENGNFTSTTDIPDIAFNSNDIETLISGDIYEITRKYLSMFYKNGKLGNFSIVKLTGQSCMINIFREALKEFVPGKSIDSNIKNPGDSISSLKLSSLNGIIRYLNSLNPEENNA